MLLCSKVESSKKKQLDSFWIFLRFESWGRLYLCDLILPGCLLVIQTLNQSAVFTHDLLFCKGFDYYSQIIYVTIPCTTMLLYLAQVQFFFFYEVTDTAVLKLSSYLFVPFNELIVLQPYIVFIYSKLVDLICRIYFDHKTVHFHSLMIHFAVQRFEPMIFLCSVVKYSKHDH